MNAHSKNTSHYFYPFFKRCFDILLSICFIILFSPLYLLIILLVKLDSKGPIFYTELRLGKGGTLFKMFKFRTMHVGADQCLEELLRSNPDMRKEWQLFHKLQKDPRCTWIGRFLRKTSLDELPQFFNVLKGSLSIVGPRPYYVRELTESDDRFLRKYAHLVLAVKPGITGIWQISGRSLCPYKNRTILDYHYSKKQSFLYDLMIIIKTIPKVFLLKGAF